MKNKHSLKSKSNVSSDCLITTRKSDFDVRNDLCKSFRGDTKPYVRNVDISIGGLCVKVAEKYFW